MNKMGKAGTILSLAAVLTAAGFIQAEAAAFPADAGSEAQAVLTDHEAINQLIIGERMYRVEKQAGTWKIVEMVSLNEADELKPLLPGTDLKIDRDAAAGLRSSYRWLAYARQQAGGEISQELLGVD